MRIVERHSRWFWCKPRLIQINPLPFDVINEHFHILPSVSFCYRYQSYEWLLMRDRNAPKILQRLVICFDWLCFHSHVVREGWAVVEE
ncbi:MAG: hypothetical protein Q4A15_11565 [Prevotellaceae bacterium]|nr:hypothetical protein [Prevotellaceae bacterium]